MKDGNDVMDLIQSGEPLCPIDEETSMEPVFDLEPIRDK